ncbi:MAG: VapC toxin family PIN domain ribonuclease [Candidatus Parabeggiatoa sp. nov. 2]|nr:MAG: hypothetical protein B6247_17780 [Beggiatoa sp. 4572_84]RKZ57677.1 MAG: VapC toxin family PIN domain ribonuclease [Gammaproteobacteria bacterium]
MIYCDTSSLVKLYIIEEHSLWVRETFREQELVTSKVALPEMFSALSRRFDEGTLTESQLQVLKTNILSDWETFTVLDFEELRAAEMVLEHHLRGFDAVHLATALLLQERVEQPVPFSTFDSRLHHAAVAAGLQVLSPEKRPTG